MKYPLMAIVLIGIATPALAQNGDWFATADKDGNGEVSCAEFLALRDANFDRLDRNHDGVVSPADFSRLAKFRPEAYAKLTEGLKVADRNGDGAISRAELTQAPPAMFVQADANGDGRVTKAEFDAARVAMKGGR